MPSNLNKAVSTNTATLIWKAGKKMNRLGPISFKNQQIISARALKSEKLFSHAPGHTEAASNYLANIWNELDLKSANSVMEAKSSTNKHFKST